ncbi:transcription initiation factor IIB-2-like [Hibiscus syriacus]|uniref:Transcription initiation factor IIB-2-like n=1 Tax=Hibiscus syriacus TaxID=106335 RepID=A0A6A3CE88_HIBSY|nr:transcription initiation factor IIB-2-like [Hibiscus syriacus]
MESLLRNKWKSTAASIWIQCSGGAIYTFGIYSSILKLSQSYDQFTLDTVSVFKDIGANCFVGYFFIWASVVGLIGRPPVPVMCLFMLLAAHAQTFFNTANVGFLGLGGAVLIQVYSSICQGNPAVFILILAVTPTLISLLFVPLVRISGTSSVDDKKNVFSYFALIIAAYLMVVIIFENVFVLPTPVRIVIFVILLPLLASPFGIEAKAHQSCLMYDLEPIPVNKCCDVQGRGEYHEIPGGPEGTNAVDLSSGEYLSDEQDHDIDFDLWRAMFTTNFWLLFIAMICGMGSSMATINNISQIGESLGYSTVERSSLVALWSIWNFLGRFGAGFLSDIMLHKGWARPLFMVITLEALTFGHLIVASGSHGNLYKGSIVVNICYGSQWLLMPTITAEVFGIRHMGTIFNAIAMASPIGSYIFSVRIIGFIYVKMATGEDKSCHGTRCFMLSFLVMASVAFVGSLVAFALFIRTGKFYGRIVLQRLGHAF